VFRGRLSNESSVRGQARRRDVLTTEISARVTEVDANGVMRIEGTRTISIDKAQQSVTIIGMVRAQDITSRNLVESWRLANAELIYASTGDLGKPKKSMLSRILGMLWP
jgi:flagellar L-ring protein precursor FlgH